MAKVDKPVGYFAYWQDPTSPELVFCDGDACVITHSKTVLKRCMMDMHAIPETDVEKAIIRKTSTGDILRGIANGAAYVLDRKTYLAFLPIANKYGAKLRFDPSLLTMSIGKQVFIAIKPDSVSDTLSIPI